MPETAPLQSSSLQSSSHPAADSSIDDVVTTAEPVERVRPLQPASTVRFGAVGCGWVARDYGVPGLLAAGHVGHVCDADLTAAAAMRAAVSTCGTPPRATASLDRLLADDTIDAVYVATPNHTHAPIVEACAAAGKAVLCEKPLAESVAAAERMVDACRRHRVPFATAYDQRWHPAHRAIAAMIRRGELGQITQARVHYACWLPPAWSPSEQPHDNWRIDAARAGGGAGIDLAPHGIDLLAMLLGQPFDELHGLTQTAVHDYRVDDGAVLMGRLGQTLASLHVGYNCPDALPRRTLELVGTGGHLVATNTMGQTPGGSVVVTDAALGTTRELAFDTTVSPFAEQAKWFAAVVRGEQSNRFDAAVDVHHHRLLLEALA